jgi:hypothetical protein
MDPRISCIAAIVLLCAAARAEPVELSVPAPVLADWAEQDGLYRQGERPDRAVVSAVIQSLGAEAATLAQRQGELLASAAGDEYWLALYRQACLLRRRQLLEPHAALLERIVFARHANLGGSHYAYTEAQSDAQAERHFTPGSALCVLEMSGLFGSVRALVEDPGGMIRDPEPTFDGRRIIFAWKKAERDDDFHLYEIDAQGGAARQLTHGAGVADYEPVCLPNGDIVFNSTRCVQTVDCWWTEVSNLYRCDKDGRFVRRLTFDQVHDNYPTLANDGRVIYTRWDYNDRGQIFPQGLFQMNGDGTAQRELYGNGSYFPTSILHARAIPKSAQYVAILTGHHTHQRGQLALIDPRRGRQENSGVQLIAPLRSTPADRVDTYGQAGPQFQHPYPLGERVFLVSMDPKGSANRSYEHPYGIYLVTIDGHRELLAWDERGSYNRPVPLSPRVPPSLPPSSVDYRRTTGTFYVHDVYRGIGLAGAPRDTIKTLRVVALDFRAAGIGQNHNRGDAGGALVSTPVSIGNGCWDVKAVLGEVPVHEDGSALFEVPARTPVYFQALDASGCAVQTMRSWVTLQPGESASCVGCHDQSGDAAPTSTPASLALRHGPTSLADSAPRGFSFRRDVQPILDANCTHCHRDRSVRMGERSANADAGIAFSLLDESVPDNAAKRDWNDAYVNLLSATGSPTAAYSGQATELVRWLDVQSGPTPLPPYQAGAVKSRLFAMLRDGHHGVTLQDEELRRIACWIDLLVPFCGDYTEANRWSDAERNRYRHYDDKRRLFERQEAEVIRSMSLTAGESGFPLHPPGAAAFGNRSNPR